MKQNIQLEAAGVPVTAVRFGGMLHDFVILNALDGTKACRAAMDVSTAWICRKNSEKNRLPSEEEQVDRKAAFLWKNRIHQRELDSRRGIYSFARRISEMSGSIIIE